MAAAHGHAALVKMLLEEKVDRTSTDEGWSALHFAAFHRRPGAVKALLEGAGPGEVNAQTSEVSHY